MWKFGFLRTKIMSHQEVVFWFTQWQYLQHNEVKDVTYCLIQQGAVIISTCMDVYQIRILLTNSLQKHLGYYQVVSVTSCSVTKECYQIGFPESSLRSFFISYSLCSEDLRIWLHSWNIYHNHATKELSKGRRIRSRKQQTSPEMLILRFSERRY